MQQYSIQDIEVFVTRFYQGRALLLTPYGYTLTFLALASLANATQQLNIAANADFIILGIRHRALLAATQTVSSKVAPAVRMLVTDSGSNEQFTNAAVDLENYSSNGVGERRLSYPRIVSGRSSLNVQLTNYSAAGVGAAETYSDIEVFFDGVLVRAYQA